MIEKIYTLLYKAYGPQGWWPFMNHEDFYHISDYSIPRNKGEVFEVCLGSILTQNTTFTSVVKSLKNLDALHALTPQGIKNLDVETFKLAIKPSDYHNQKAKYILGFIDFFLELQGAIPKREKLLEVLGIGEETADSILLYGYRQTEFKVDAYTKRLLLELGLITQKAKYKDIKKLMQDALEESIEDKKELLITYQEYHALIVQHSKRFYSKKPYGAGCFLKDALPLT